MPNFNSKDGVWTPATERVVYYDKDGMPQIYQGPDRGARRLMIEEGLDPENDTLGMHFSEDSQIIERAHDKHMTIEEFTKQKIHTQKKRDAAYEENAKKIVTHALPEKKPYKKGKGQTGGMNFAGTGHLEGGFGDGNALDDAVKSVDKKTSK